MGPTTTKVHRSKMRYLPSQHFWSGDQYQNYFGSSRAASALNTDKEINTQWL
jgi:hypothetical protein